MPHGEMDKPHKMRMDIIKVIIPLSIVAKCFVNYWNYSCLLYTSDAADE